MKRLGIGRKILVGVLVLSVSLGQSTPVFALRTTQVAEQTDSGLQDLVNQLRPAPAQQMVAPIDSLGGLEENSNGRRWGIFSATALALLFGGILWFTYLPTGNPPPADNPKGNVVFQDPGRLKPPEPPKKAVPLPAVDPLLAAVHSGVIDDTALRNLQIKMLEEQSKRADVPLELNRQWAVWIQLQLAKGYASRADSEYANLALERTPVASQEKQVLSIQQKFLTAPLKNRAALYGELQRAIDDQLSAEIGYWEHKLKLDTWSDRADIKFREGIVGSVKAREESLARFREKIGIHVDQLKEMRLLYADLGKLGSYLPLPGIQPEGVSLLDIREMVPVIAPPAKALTKEEKEGVIASARDRIDRLLDLESQMTEADDTIASLYYYWTARQNKLGYIAGRAFDSAEYHEKLNSVRAAGRKVLAAQRTLVKATTPDGQLFAQLALDDANRKHLEAMIGQAKFRVDQLAVQVGKTTSAKLLPVWIGSDDKVALAIAQIDADGLKTVQEVFGSLTELGMPTFPLAVQEPRSSLLNFQALVPPVVIGLPTPADEAEARKLYEKLLKVPGQLKQQRVAVIQAEADKLSEEAHKEYGLYQAAHPELAKRKGYMSGISYENWIDVMHGSDVKKAQSNVRKKLIVLVDMEESGKGFLEARKAYEQALFDQIDAELTRVGIRLEYREDRLALYQRKSNIFFNHIPTWMELVAADRSIQTQLNDQKKFYQELQKAGIPLPALGAAVSTHPSADSLQLLLGDKGSTPLSGVVWVQKGEKQIAIPVISGEGQWMWLSRPRYLPEGGDRKISTTRVIIPKGLPGEGRSIPKERLLAVAAFTEFGPKEYVIAVQGDWRYEEQSGYYWVVGGTGIYSVGPEAIRLGLLAKGDPKDPAKLLPPTQGFVGYVTYQVRPVRGPKGETILEPVPVGVTTRHVSLEVYNQKGKDGKEAPIPLASLVFDEEGRMQFGRLYVGGPVTYGPKGETYFGGKKNEPGEKLPILYERTSARILLAQPEIRIVFDEVMGRPILSMTHHPVESLPQAGKEEDLPVATVAEGLRRLPGELEGAVLLQTGGLSRDLRELSVGPDSNISMAAAILWADIQQRTAAEAIPAVRQVQVGFPSADVETPRVFLFDETQYPGQDAGYVAWAPFVAKSGVSVAVLTNRLTVAEGLNRLFRESGLREDQYRVVSVEAYGGDREAALRSLEESFSGMAGFVPIHPSVGFEVMKKILEEMGFVLYAAEFKVDFQKVQAYLDSLA